MIKIRCSECHRVHRVSDRYAGKNVRCRMCSQVNTIPQPENETLGNGDSISAYNDLLRELAKAEKDAPTVENDP